VKPEAVAAGARVHVLAPAKLNLGLRIVGLRAGGYHELESVFAPLDLADEIELEIAAAPQAGVRLELANAPPGVPADATNLAVRAAEGFLAAASLAREASIRLTKRIPTAAGLGGGSSDAGAVLRALAASFPDALDPEQLARLALGLGADVPYFLAPCLARVTGIGERIQRLADFAPLACLLVNPGVPLATAAVFAAWDDRPEPAAAAIDPELGLDLANDLAGPAERLCPAIAPLRERLRALGARAVGVSGSGPTVFGIFSDPAEAARARARAAFPSPIWARVAQSAKAG
jgi:4-diphosphocytidyl-2-C-methyl-D-erythritol kinase